MLSLTADIGGYSKQVIQEDAIWYELNITFSISPPFMASMRCATYAILVECFRDSPRQCPVQYLHWSIKHLSSYYSLFHYPSLRCLILEYIVWDILYSRYRTSDMSYAAGLGYSCTGYCIHDIVTYIFVTVLYIIK